MLNITQIKIILGTFLKTKIIPWLRNNWPVATLVFLAIAAQSLAFIAIINGKSFMWGGDTDSYLELAKNFITNKCFCIKPEWGPSTFRTPLYPLFIALFYSVVPKIWFVIVIQNILAVINILLTYKLGKLIFNSKVGWLGALFLIFESSRLVLTNQLMSESLFVFLLLLSVYYFHKFIKEDTARKYLVWASIYLGLAALTRPVAQFYFLIVILFFVILGIFRKDIKKYLLAGLLILISFLVIISPWLVRNYIHFKRFELSSLGGFNVYVVAAARFLEYKAVSRGERLDAFPILIKQFVKYVNPNWSTKDPDWWIKSTRLMEPPYEDYLLQEGRKIISTDWPFYLKVHFRRTIVFFVESGMSRNYGVLLSIFHLPKNLFYPFLYFGGRILWVLSDLIIVASIFFGWKEFRKNFWSKLLLVMTILYFAGMSSLHSDASRMRQPVNPFFFLFVANAIVALHHKIKKHPDKALFSGWGNYQKIAAEVLEPKNVEELQAMVRQAPIILPRGLGRSYGDAAMSSTMLSLKRMNRILNFDKKNGVLTAEGGVSLKEILEKIIPAGWFLAVTPGTKYVTLGGAIAADVHGKNHHQEGSLGDYIVNMNIVRSDGELVTCSKTKQTELFCAVIGGMGLVGVIAQATIRLKQIGTSFISQTIVRTKNLEETFDALEQAQNVTYSITWLDTTATDQDLGRGVVFLGEHASVAVLPQNLVPLRVERKKPWPIFFPLPNFLLIKISARVFNKFYYYLHPSGQSLASYDSFFYPLDRFANWNRLYGQRGFLEYQCVVPKFGGREAIRLILEKIASVQLPAFLAGLKIFGPANNNLLSFPTEGYTLGLDFPVRDGIMQLFASLNEIVSKAGGRLYLAKDACMPKEIFNLGYPDAEEFRKYKRLIDPSNKFRSLQSMRLGLY